MKRILSLCLALAMLFSLAACSQTPNGPAGSAPPPAVSTSASPAPAVYSADILALEAAVAGGGDASALERLSDQTDAAGLEGYVLDCYGLSSQDWTNLGCWRLGGAQAFEVTVLAMADEDAAVQAISGLEDYLHRREGDFTGYFPQEAQMVSEGLAFATGCYAVLLICPDPSSAQDTLLDLLSGRIQPSVPVPPAGSDPAETSVPETAVPTPEPSPASTQTPAPAATPTPALPPEPTEPALDTPFPSLWGPFSPPPDSTAALEPTEEPVPEPTPTPAPTPAPSAAQYPVTYPGRTPYTPPTKDDMTVYDTSAILAAWDSKDPSGLGEYDRTIYDRASAVLNRVLKDGMDAEEIEWALYEWVITNMEYDQDHEDPLATVSRDSFTPYGGLVYGKGVCLGFASLFQLLMDMAGQECILVVGAAYDSEDNHAWNMVKLDGTWYCVDATWDWTWYTEYRFPTRYFNVSSDFMAEEHQWDYNNVPEAPASLPQKDHSFWF